MLGDNNEFLESWKPYFKNDIIVQADGDSGDSCQRTSTAILLNLICGRKDFYIFSRMLFQIQSSRGRFRRSNNKDHWGSRPSNCSRDQLSIARLAMAAFKYKRPFLSSYFQQLLRLGFHQNFLKGCDDPNERWKLPDIMSPAEVTTFIRATNLWVFWPFVMLLDVLKLIDVLMRKKDNWDQDNMLAQHLYFSAKYMPNPIAILSLALYLNTNYMERIANYYALQNNGIPPMTELFKEAENKMREYLWVNFWYVRFLLR